MALSVEEAESVEEAAAAVEAVMRGAWCRDQSVSAGVLGVLLVGVASDEKSWLNARYLVAPQWS